MNKLRNSAIFLSALVGGQTGIAQTQSPKMDESKPQTDKMNVIFIVCDDLNADLGSFDDSIVKTPNLDRICKHAVRFNNAYCQYPLSGPTRASFLTGYSPDRTKVTDLTTNFRTAMPDAVTLPQLFKNNGYQTIRVGKVYHANVPADIGHDGVMDDKESWTKKWNPVGIDKTMEEHVHIVTPQLVRGNRIGGSLAYLEIPGSDDEHTDAIGANIACMEIHNNKSKPFFLAMGFYRPHTPYIAPSKYFKMYPWQDMPLPDVPADDWDNKPSCARTSPGINFGLPDEELKKAKAAYYATLTFMDAQIGKILDKLDKEGLAGNTAIVFVGDNGYNLGQHGQWQKQMLFEHATRVPLMISVPGLTNGKDSYDKPVELLDIYPTLAAVCGLKAPDDLDGRDISPLLKDVNTPWKENAYSIQTRKPGAFKSTVKEFTIGRSVRTERYRYTEWNDGRAGGELYDYLNDPTEHYNLYNNKKYKKLQSQLADDLHRHFADIIAKDKK